MEHLGTKELYSERLHLRRFTLDDAAVVYKNWGSDKEVTKYLMWQTYTSIDDAVKWCQYNVDSYQNDNYYSWLIVPKDIGEAVGSIAVVDHNDRVEMVHIGYALGRSFWNKGYMTEALETVMRFFFEEVGVNRIESRHDPRNLASGKVMQKAGMQFEGLSRMSDWNNSGICDCVLYGMLKEDYMKRLTKGV